MDEHLLPVNFDASSQSNWCSANQPPLISRILEQMLLTATRYTLRMWTDIQGPAVDPIDAFDACPLGLSYCIVEKRCKPITAIKIPVYLWIRGPHSTEDSLPTMRSIYPCSYARSLKSESKDGIEEGWKSVYSTQYTLLLKGLSIHLNDIDSRLKFPIRAPRAFHGGLSLELVHQRWDNRGISKQNMTQLMTSDYRLVHLVNTYHTCMLRLQ